MANRRRDNDRGWQLSKKDNEGNTPLHCAARGGHPASVKFLLDVGAPVDEVNRRGETALHIACLEGFDEVVRVLLQGGASPRVEDQNGSTPWHIASVNGYASILAILAEIVVGNESNEEHSETAEKTEEDASTSFENEESLNYKTNDRRTPIYLAATNDQDTKECHSDQVSNGSSSTKLVGHENEENIQNGDEVSTGMELTLIPRTGGRRLNKNWEDIYHSSESMDSVDEDEPVVNQFQTIVQDYFDALCSDDTEPHILESIRRDVEHLLNDVSRVERIDVNMDLGGGLTLLHVAAATRAEQPLRMLLRRNANVRARTRKGLTPLMMAAAGGSVDIFKLLMAAGADPWKKDRSCRTALHFAARRSAAALVAFLLSLGLDPTAADIHGITPFDLIIYTTLINQQRA